ncbi:hypothetical protein ACJX0J_018290, partial [Zea mays]
QWVEGKKKQSKIVSKLHDVWFVAENVLEELQNYQAICELGSKVGAVEEDIDGMMILLTLDDEMVLPSSQDKGKKEEIQDWVPVLLLLDIVGGT